jgi:hypothetical protein
LDYAKFHGRHALGGQERRHAPHPSGREVAEVIPSEAFFAGIALISLAGRLISFEAFSFTLKHAGQRVKP